MGSSISILYYNREKHKFLKKQEIKKEFIQLNKKKKRRDTPYPFLFVQSPTRDNRDMDERFNKLLKVLYV